MGNYGGSNSPDQIQALPAKSDNANFAQKINEIIQKLNRFLLSPDEVSAASQMAVGREYIANHASVRVILTLPVNAAKGDTITVHGKGAAGWKVAQNAGQVIHAASDSTVGVGGSVASGARYNCLTLECITQNSDWLVVSHEGTLTFV